MKNGSLFQRLNTPRTRLFVLYCIAYLYAYLYILSLIEIEVIIDKILE